MHDRKDRLVRKGNYIQGSFIKPESVDGYINCVNPGDRQDLLGRFPFSAASVDDAVSHGREATTEWRKVGLNDRAGAIRRFRDKVSHYQDSIAILITRETGKPLWEAHHEVLDTLGDLDVLLDEGIDLLAPHVLDKNAGRTDFVPRGVVGLLCPYMPAFQLAAVQSAAAVLAGNAVVFKPSKFSPAVGQVVAETWDRCRMPRGVVHMVQGSGSVVGTRLATHPGLDALVCTGSFKTAMGVRKALFRRPELPVVYQCGGKGIAVVLEDAELENAVYEVMVGAFLTSGQRHNSTGRVIVHEALYDAFVKELVHRSSRLNIGYGFEPTTFMGPLISENYRTRYRKYLRALETKGHEMLLSGGAHRAPDRRGFYASPAIVGVDWKKGSAFLNDEPPGPVLLVYKAKDAEEAATLHNQAVYRLVCSVFTRRKKKDLAAALEAFDTGSINVNRATIGQSMRLPSVGLGRASGGIPGALALLRSLTHPRSRLVAVHQFDPSLAAPGTRWRESDIAETIGETDEVTQIKPADHYRNS